MTDALAEEEQELEALVESLDKICTRYKMEISAEKTRFMRISAYDTQMEIKVKKTDASNISELLPQMMAQNQRFSQGLQHCWYFNIYGQKVAV